MIMDEKSRKKWDDPHFLKPFADLDALKEALEDTLSLDIRSPFQKRKHGNNFEGDLHFHKFKVIYSLMSISHDLTVVDIMDIVDREEATY